MIARNTGCGADASKDRNASIFDGGVGNAAARATLAAIATLAALSLGSCDVFGSLASQTAEANQPIVRFLEAVDGEIDLSVYSSDTDRTAWVIFTAGEDGASGSASAEASSLASRASLTASSASSRDSWRAKADAASVALRSKARAALAAGASTVSPRLSSSGGDPSGDVVGDTEYTFHLAYGDASGNSADITAACRLVESGVDFGDRTRSLSIWVQDSQWSGTTETDGMVSQSKIEALAEAFFGTAADRSSSIYAWETNMLGDEWGTHSGSISYAGYTYDLIAESDNITILLADIADDASNTGGVVGYFYSLDNMQNVEGSNERVMFTIDSVMYGTGDGTWDSGDYWPETVFSTLAHEFQHMIHFYQKGVVAGGDYFDEPTWIDELCSMQVEDLLSDKLGVPGPRGVEPDDGTAGSSGNTDGRMPYYLVWPELSPEGWDSASDEAVLYYYSWAYAFGAYLTRNYGGAEFIRRVVQSEAADSSAITAAASAYSGNDETIEDLLRRWGAAVLLSSREDAPEYYRYNTGGYISSTIGDITYRLGSIDVFNYLFADGLDTNGDGYGDADATSPYEYYASTIREFRGDPLSNAFMDLGEASDKPSWKLTVPDGMLATIVID